VWVVVGVPVSVIRHGHTYFTGDVDRRAEAAVLLMACRGDAPWCRMAAIFGGCMPRSRAAAIVLRGGQQHAPRRLRR